MNERFSCIRLSLFPRWKEKNKDELLKSMPQDKQEAIAFLRDFMADAKEKDEINKVASTMSGVELTQFCINQNHREKCKKEQDDLTGIGAIIFYRYVLPIAKEIKQRAGCKFMYLFAADNTEDESLIKYYKDKLSFSTVSEFDASGLGERIVVPIMPFYDYRCEFMIRTIQNVNRIKIFNPDVRYGKYYTSGFFIPDYVTTIFNIIYERRLTLDNPARAFKVTHLIREIEEEKKVKQVFSPKDIKKMWEYVDVTPYTDMVLIGLYTGFRPQ